MDEFDERFMLQRDESRSLVPRAVAFNIDGTQFPREFFIRYVGEDYCSAEEINTSVDIDKSMISKLFE